jgi:hypothetical protein
MKKIVTFFSLIFVLHFFLFTDVCFGQWQQMGLYISPKVHSYTSLGNNLFAGTIYNTGVYKSTNGGVNWSQTSLTNQSVNSLEVLGNSIFAGTVNGIYISTNYGTNWYQSTLNNKSILSIKIINMVFPRYFGQHEECNHAVCLI